MITQDDEHFSQNWDECLMLIETAKVAMGDKDPCPVGWEEEMMSKWIVKPDIPDLEEEPDPEAEPPTEEEVKAKEAAKAEKEAAEAEAEKGRLMGRFEKWSQIRQVLWEHYCPDDGIRHQHELDSLAPWESEPED